MNSSSRDAVSVDAEDLRILCTAALRRTGAAERVADLLAEAALFAELHGMTGVGVPHLLDYLSALHEGRLDGAAEPQVTRPSGAVLHCDAERGVFHTGFDLAFADLVTTARDVGVAVLIQQNAYAGGQLGWFTHRLAESGLMALATVNSSALMSTGPGVGRVFGTNPMAFSVPRRSQAPITVDQASSAAAYANVREAVSKDQDLPTGWALDSSLRPTQDPQAALAGAMLPFGGYKGANVAWFVELFSVIGGGLWSVDAPSAYDGPDCPAVGMFLLALDPTSVAADFATRVEQHVERLATLGVRRPGIEQASALSGQVEVRRSVLSEIERQASGA